jgi:uncharacterized protein YegJ (DUF2314 family)
MNRRVCAVALLCLVSCASCSRPDSMASLINSLAQALAEGTQAGRAGEVALRLKALRNTAARERQTRDLKPNAKGEARLRLLQGRWETGDPQNRLIEIGFDRYPRSEATVRHEAAIADLFGATDSITYARHDQEVLAASRRAREKLPLLRHAFEQGLAPGEYILLKAPFAATNGTEWMWVEVVSWKGNDIEGILSNDPIYVPGLHAGARVAISEERVFDYVHTLPDGKQEGNETSAILEKQDPGKQ